MDGHPGALGTAFVLAGLLEALVDGVGHLLHLLLDGPVLRLEVLRRTEVAERRRHLLHYLMVVALILIGFVLMFIPGPAVVMFGLAAALLAEDSLRIAKALDWLELKIRALVRVA